MSAPPGAPKASPVSARDLIFYYLRRHRLRFAAGFLLLAGTNVLALSVPRLLKHAVDALQAADASSLLVFTSAIVAVALVQGGTRTLSRLAILGASRQVAYELRGRLFSHMQRLPMASYSRRPVGDMTSRAINDMLLVRSFFGPGLMNLVNTSLVYLTALTMMFTMDTRLTLYALAPYPIFMLAVNRLSRRIYGRTIAVQEQLAALTSKAQENISGINLIKTYAREPHEARAWTAMSRDYLEKALSLARARGAMTPLMGIMASAGTLVVVGLGGRAVIAGRLSLGDFVAFNAYLAFLVWPTFAFGWILNTFQRGAAAMGRIAEILAEPAEERSSPELDAEPSVAALPPAVSVRGLTFAHEGAPPGTVHLKDVSLDVPAGGAVGILGIVGSGKTTLINMLPRMLTPPAGRVFIGGRDVTTIPLGTLRREIAMVPQESFLFSRSIRQNIALTPRQVTEAEIDDAVLASGLARDLPRFPEGLDTIVGERGFTVSGGQRQRVAIARALVARPSILIMDDALSSLDAQVERDVVEALRQEKGRATIVIVSHRVAALSWTDQILVMDSGAVVERGAHEELIRSGGLYALIARRQSLASTLEQL